MATILVTGANRGIGLELCRQLKGRGDEVIAACRRVSADLGRLGTKTIDSVDVATADGVAQLAAGLDGQRLDVLVHNAGILRRDRLDSLNYDDMLEQFRVNALGPLRVTEALLDNLASGARIAIVTSRMGSMADNGSGGYYGYRVSKAAVNMIGLSLARDLESRGIATALLHPGMVATEMTGGQGIPVDESARGLIGRIDAMSLANSGSFWHAPDDAELPW